MSARFLRFGASKLTLEQSIGQLYLDVRQRTDWNHAIAETARLGRHSMTEHTENYENENARWIADFRFNASWPNDVFHNRLQQDSGCSEHTRESSRREQIGRARSQ
jgi:hypothetical protein